MYDTIVSTGCNPDPEYRDDMCGYNTTVGCIPIDGCGSPLAFFYFSSFTILISFVLLNVFIAVILEGFSNEKEADSTTLSEEEVCFIFFLCSFLFLYFIYSILCLLLHGRYLIPMRRVLLIGRIYPLF